MVSIRRTNFDEEDNYESERFRIREPLIHQQPIKTSGSTHSDIWSSRIREKVSCLNLLVSQISSDSLCCKIWRSKCRLQDLANKNIKEGKYNKYSECFTPTFPPKKTPARRPPPPPTPPLTWLPLPYLICVCLINKACNEGSAWKLII